MCVSCERREKPVTIDRRDPAKPAPRSPPRTVSADRQLHAPVSRGFSITDRPLSEGVCAAPLCATSAILAAAALLATPYRRPAHPRSASRSRSTSMSGVTKCPRPPQRQHGATAGDTPTRLMSKLRYAAPHQRLRCEAGRVSRHRQAALDGGSTRMPEQRGSEHRPDPDRSPASDAPKRPRCQSALEGLHRRSAAGGLRHAADPRPGADRNQGGLRLTPCA
jgi:hypothetical protein